MNHLEIVNRSIILAGENPLTSITGSNTGVFVQAFYEKCWRDILSHHNWTAFTKQTELTGEEREDQIPMYEFDLPADTLKVSAILLPNGDEAKDVQRIGRKLLSQWDVLELRYVSGDGIIPVADYSEEIDADIPSFIEECVMLKLASQIIFKISNNNNLQAQMHNRFIVALQEAKMNDGYGSSGDSLWGDFSYGNG